MLFDQVFENQYGMSDDDRHLLQMAERGMMNIDRWISKWCHEITSISKCNETAQSWKNMCVYKLYFRRTSSLSLVVRGLVYLLCKISQFFLYSGIFKRKLWTFPTQNVIIKSHLIIPHFDHSEQFYGWFLLHFGTQCYHTWILVNLKI